MARFDPSVQYWGDSVSCFTIVLDPCIRTKADLKQCMVSQPSEYPAIRVYAKRRDSGGQQPMLVDGSSSSGAGAAGGAGSGVSVKVVAALFDNSSFEPSEAIQTVMSVLPNWERQLGEKLSAAEGKANGAAAQNGTISHVPSGIVGSVPARAEQHGQPQVNGLPGPLPPPPPPPPPITKAHTPTSRQIDKGRPLGPRDQLKRHMESFPSRPPQATLKDLVDYIFAENVVGPDQRKMITEIVQKFLHDEIKHQDVYMHIGNVIGADFLQSCIRVVHKNIRDKMTAGGHHPHAPQHDGYPPPGGSRGLTNGVGRREMDARNVRRENVVLPRAGAAPSHASANGAVNAGRGAPMPKSQWEKTSWIHVDAIKKKSVLGPNAGHAMLVNPEKFEAYFFGGQAKDDASFSNLWVLDLRTFRSRRVECGGDRPPNRSLHTVNYISRHAAGQVLLFGGLGDDGRCLKDIHCLELAEFRWTLKQAFGSSQPSARYGHTAAVWPPESEIPGRDKDSEFLFVFGGHSAVSELNDFFAFHIESSTWVKVDTGRQTSGPSKRFAHKWDWSGLKTIILFGGCCGRADGGSAALQGSNETWKFEVEAAEPNTLEVRGTWSIIPTRETPAGRWGHGLGFMSHVIEKKGRKNVDRCLIVVGGESEDQQRRKAGHGVVALNLKTNQWEKLEHITPVAVGEGGADGASFAPRKDFAFLFYEANPFWSPVENASGLPKEKMVPAPCILLHGGTDTRNTVLGDTWILSLVGPNPLDFYDKSMLHRPPLTPRQPEASPTEGMPEPVDDSLIQRTIVEAQMSGGKRPVDYTGFDCTPSLLYSLTTIQRWFLGAVAHLVDNAITHPPDPHRSERLLEIRIEHKTIPNSGKTALLVSDNGFGMEESTFHRFLHYWGDPSDTPGKSHQYGMGFKMAFARIARNCLVVTKAKHTMSVGLLSLELLEEAGVRRGIGAPTLSWNRATRSLTSGRDVRTIMMFYDTRPWTDLDHLYEADACLRIPHNAKTHKAHTMHQTTPTPQPPPPAPAAEGREQNGDHEGSKEPPLKRVKDDSATMMDVDVAASGGGGAPEATSVLDVCERFPFWSDARGSPDYCMATYLFWLYLTPPDQTPKVALYVQGTRLTDPRVEQQLLKVEDSDMPDAAPSPAPVPASAPTPAPPQSEAPPPAPAQGPTAPAPPPAAAAAAAEPASTPASEAPQPAPAAAAAAAGPPDMEAYVNEWIRAASTDSSQPFHPYVTKGGGLCATIVQDMLCLIAFLPPSPAPLATITLQQLDSFVASEHLKDARRETRATWSDESIEEFKGCIIRSRPDEVEGKEEQGAADGASVQAAAAASAAAAAAPPSPSSPAPARPSGDTMDIDRQETTDEPLPPPPPQQHQPQQQQQPSPPPPSLPAPTADQPPTTLVDVLTHRLHCAVELNYLFTPSDQAEGGWGMLGFINKPPNHTMRATQDRLCVSEAGVLLYHKKRLIRRLEGPFPADPALLSPKPQPAVWRKVVDGSETVDRRYVHVGVDDPAAIDFGLTAVIQVPDWMLATVTKQEFIYENNLVWRTFNHKLRKLLQSYLRVAADEDLLQQWKAKRQADFDASGPICRRQPSPPCNRSPPSEARYAPMLIHPRRSLWPEKKRPAPASSNNGSSVEGDNNAAPPSSDRPAQAPSAAPAAAATAGESAPGPHQQPQPAPQVARGVSMRELLERVRRVNDAVGATNPNPSPNHPNPSMTVREWLTRMEEE
ncbi:unnamed protein product [Vitrella brassicaformis CCMP3155]|uniref:Uncharacterized protein n=3 Tax=Vitrella brassicaformis TaxID=1169539 RepID=A0A0G4EM49_VITBC|nr:unnamed protein product [Vitrella brassicaformis CCMP3155]|eukprot:CEL98039.1 unnamed protein product [Vitrella brassicaformis CCMP3155]